LILVGVAHAEVGMPEETLELLARWRDRGDEDAAAELYQRYVQRLIALARHRIGKRLGRRLDAEDVVQSACRSFFVRVQDGRLQVRPGDDIRQLLAAITMHKVFRQLEHHTAGKRSIRREDEQRPSDSACSILVEAVARDPSPAEELAAQEELEAALAPLSPLHQRIVELRLAGCTQPEIAGLTGRSERQVRTVIAEFARKFQRRLQTLTETEPTERGDRA
jgi:RNA polymerase sigma factor (sigma-70 family)